MDTAAVMQDPAKPAASQQSPPQQWDLFEVVLSKPSGSQKLGMVLKHVQVEERLKKGAYLASLAEGPSLAQDLGLAPKDRLLRVAGVDVKTLPFDRIVGLIRKAFFPLTLVWSRQRKAGEAINLPGTAVGPYLPCPAPSPLSSSLPAAAAAAAPSREPSANGYSSDNAAVAATATAVTEDWVQATNRGRAASRATREAEEEREGTDRYDPRVSSTAATVPEQQQHVRGGNGIGVGERTRKMQIVRVGGPMERDPDNGQRTKTATTTVAATGGRRSPTSTGGRARGVAMSFQQQQELRTEKNGNDRSSAGGSSTRSSRNDAPAKLEMGAGRCMPEEERVAEQLKVETEHKYDRLSRRRERDRARRERARQQMEQGRGEGIDGDGVLGGSGSVNNNSHPLQGASAASGRDNSGRAVSGKGGSGGRRVVGRGGKGRGIAAEAERPTAAEAAAAEAAAAAAAAAAGEARREDLSSPEWLNPLMKTQLAGFEGTRHARSRLKQILTREWAQQEYRTGIALGQVNRSVTEMEFMRRRVEGSQLYALLEKESRDYLRVGPFSDADVELLGQSFAQVQASKELPPPAASDSDTAAALNPKVAGSAKEKPTTTPKTKMGKPSIVKAVAAAAAGGSTSWADRLREFQVDVPASPTSKELESDFEEGVDLVGSEAGPRTEQSVRVAPQGGGQQEDPLAWDGVGADAATVIQHRRQFDMRCRAYEGLNNASRNDKTNALLEKTHRLHQEHATIIVAKRATLEGTLQSVRQQLNVREEQLRHVHMEQCGANPLDSALVASLNESEAAIVTRVTEKKAQMAMIIDEANKVVQWEQTAELARREALLHAANMHGHGGVYAAGTIKERNELVQTMMSQKANIMLLSTFCKLRGPWLAPPEYVRRSRPVPSAAGAAAATGDGTEPNPGGFITATAVAAAAEEQGGSPQSRSGGGGSDGVGVGGSNSTSPTNAASGLDAAGSELADGEGEGEGVAVKPGKRHIKLRLLPPSQKRGNKERGSGDNPTQVILAHPRPPQTGQEGKGNGEGVDVARAGPNTATAAVETTSQAVDGVGPSSMAAVMARGGKEAAMARLTGARGAAAVEHGVDGGNGGGDGSAPMDFSVSTGSGSGSGEGEEDDGPKSDGSSFVRPRSPLTHAVG